MKKILILWVALLFQGCLHIDSDFFISPDPWGSHVIRKDSLSRGSYRGIHIGHTAQEVYMHLQDSLKPEYINVVDNRVKQWSTLKQQLPLYTMVLCDQERGTSNGAQLSFENQRLKSIYLNNGVKLGAWPEAYSSQPVIREGDSAETVAEKLMELHLLGHAAVERTQLPIKLARSPYDPQMELNKEWYVTLKIDNTTYDYIHFHFEQGKVKYILIKRRKISI